MDKLTDGKNVEETSCTSDFKRCALAKGKLVFIPYLLFHHFDFSPLLIFLLHV